MRPRPWCFLFSLGLGLLLVLFTTTVSMAAAPLPPGATLELPVWGTSLEDYSVGSPPTGTYSNLVASFLHSTFTGTGGTNPSNFSGWVDSYVYQDPTTRNLLFLYQFTNSSTSAGSGRPELTIATLGMTAHSWSGIEISDAGAGGDYGADTFLPSWLSRSSSGSVLSLEWDRVGVGGWPVVDRSELVWFVTDARDYQPTDVTVGGQTDGNGDRALSPVFGGGATALLPSYVPEPTSGLLYGLGLGLGLIVCRRKRG